MLRIYLPLLCMLSFIAFQYIQAQNYNPILSEIKNDTITLISDDKPSYFLQLLEKKIFQLTHAETSDTLFKEAINITRLVNSEQVELDINEYIVDLFDDVKTDIDSSFEARRLYEIARLVTSSRFLLKVDINPLGDNLEYQLNLYQTANIKEAFTEDNEQLKLGLPILDIIKPFRSVNVFFQPSSDNFEFDVETTLRKLFPETNSPPVIVIDANYIIKKDSIDISGTSPTQEILIFPINEPINISLAKSYDKDTPKERLRYNWKNLTNYSFKSENFPLSYGEKTQQSILSKKGIYIIEVEVTDQISPIRDTLMFITVERPRLSFTNGDTLGIKKLKLEFGDVGQLPITVKYALPKNRLPFFRRAIENEKRISFEASSEFGQKKFPEFESIFGGEYKLLFPLSVSTTNKNYTKYKINLINHGISSNPIYLEMKTKTFSGLTIEPKISSKFLANMAQNGKTLRLSGIGIGVSYSSMLSRNSSEQLGFSILRYTNNEFQFSYSISGSTPQFVNDQLINTSIFLMYSKKLRFNLIERIIGPKDLVGYIIGFGFDTYSPRSSLIKKLESEGISPTRDRFGSLNLGITLEPYIGNGIYIGGQAYFFWSHRSSIASEINSFPQNLYGWMTDMHLRFCF